MYFGSVKFFRHLIYSVIILLIIVPSALAVAFGLKYSDLKAQALQVSESDFQPPLQLTEEDILNYILDKNLTGDSMISFLEENDIAVMSDIFKSHYSDTSTELGYTSEYPDLYTEAPTEYSYQDNMIYLTFDDGPSENTIMILSILDKYNIKATFFVTGAATDRSKYILGEIVSRGHTLAIHTYSHDMPLIYTSVEAYLDDFYKIYNLIYEATGVKPNVFRFAGGSINSYNRLMYREIIAEMSRRGFVYYDWNVSGEDASGYANWTSIYNNVTKGMEGKSRGIILLHDGTDKYTTVTVVEDLILYFQRQGYEFDRITNDVKPITFGYVD